MLSLIIDLIFYCNPLSLNKSQWISIENQQLLTQRTAQFSIYDQD